MMVQLKIKHKRIFIMSQLKIMFDNFVLTTFFDSLPKKNFFFIILI